VAAVRDVVGEAVRLRQVPKAPAGDYIAVL